MQNLRSTLVSLFESEFTAGRKPNKLQIYPAAHAQDEQGIAAFYAPFEGVNPTARVILIGITPGASQMRRAWTEWRRAAQAGTDPQAAISEVKRLASFNDDRNQMRPNLYAQLEDWGVHQWLGCRSGAGLFERGWRHLQTTSLITYPTFQQDKNYEGKSPKPLKHPFLRSLVLEHFVPLLKSLPNALLLPLGGPVEATLKELYAQRLIANPCIYGMLHPSGNNTYRVKYLCGPRTGPVPSKTNVQSYDAGRAEFRRAYLEQPEQAA